jgi:hypothetical protein
LAEVTRVWEAEANKAAQRKVHPYTYNLTLIHSAKGDRKRRAEHLVNCLTLCCAVVVRVCVW